MTTPVAAFGLSVQCWCAEPRTLTASKDDPVARCPDCGLEIIVAEAIATEPLLRLVAGTDS